MRSVDILMATYQGSKFLTAQIESILCQTHHNWRLIISDDGSTDSTWEMLHCFRDPRLTILPKHERLGVINNFSFLLSHACSPYIMFCDQDDVWFPDKVAKTLEKMKEMEAQFGTSFPLLVHTDLTVVDDSLDLIHPSFWAYTRLDSKHRKTLNKLLVQNCVTGCTVMINQPLQEIASPIPHHVRMHDWWLALTAAAFGEIGVLEESTMLYRQHTSNSVGAKPYRLMNYVKRWLKKDFQKEANSKQATLFLERYRSSLDQTVQKTIHAYLAYCQSQFWEKRYLMLQYGFHKSGFLRKLYDWIS